MKSIKQQYIDLKEGRMSQANFMRNLRMTMPQYVTNVTSFNDAVKILRNKGILTEGKTKLTADQVNNDELRMGIKVEMEHTDDPEKAKKIALDHLAENPFYYTQLKLSGVDTKATPSKEKKAIEKKKDETEMVDKANQMKTPKGVEKIKASSNKAKKETNKPVKGISSMSLVSKTSRGVKKMDATGEKMKKIKENKDTDKKIDVAKTIFDRNATLTTNLNKIARGEDIGYPEVPPVEPKQSVEDKLREAIRKIIRQEIYDGRDNMTDVTGENN